MMEKGHAVRALAGFTNLTLQSPIRDEKYRTGMKARLFGRKLGALIGWQLDISVTVEGDEIVLRGAEGKLHHHEGLTSRSVEMLGPWTRNVAGIENPSAQHVAQAVWDLHLRRLDVHGGASFD